MNVIVSDDAHSTVFSALQYLGLGRDMVRRVPTDAQGSIIAKAFDQAIADSALDAAVIAILQAGQINTGAFDPMSAAITAARSHRNCWVHVDGAFGLWARACPEYASLAEGIEYADSWATDGHKWLQTPYDCGYAIVRDAVAHRRAMTIAASYLPTIAAGERDPSHYVPELSRRARGFSTWAMLKHISRDGVANMVERHCRLARFIAEELAAEEGIAILNEVALNQIAVRFGASESDADGDVLTLRTIAAVQEDGVCFAGGAKWKEVWIMRLSVIGFAMTEDDASASESAIVRAWRRVRFAKD